MSLGVIRFQAEGFLELADRLVGLAFLAEGDAEVVVGLGVIRFQADGFLVLADRLVSLAFLAEGDAEVVVGSRHCQVGAPRPFGNVLWPR